MMTLKRLMETFPNDDACKKFIMKRRWPNGVKCPRCASEKVYQLKSRPWHWVCKACTPTKRSAYRFSVTVGTIFENTNIHLKTWFEVLWQMLNSKKGVSALQISRQIGTTHQTAWYLCHRLRAGMTDPDFKKLMGIVEVDETYIGGKDRNRHWDKKQHATGGSTKIGVIGAISRKGNVVCRIIETADRATLNDFVTQAVSDKVNLVATDEHPGYNQLGKLGFRHKKVRHTAGEYVHGNVHTNNLDSFWSLLKRGIMGTYHNVSRKYLPLYLNEFSYRFNNRENDDIFEGAVAGC